MKTQNFVLEWFQHQARLKEDRTRSLFERLAQEALEVFEEPKTEAQESNDTFDLPTRYLSQP